MFFGERVVVLRFVFFGLCILVVYAGVEHGFAVFFSSREADAPGVGAVGEAAFAVTHVGPCAAAVGAFPDAAACARAVEVPSGAGAFPSGCVQRVGVNRVEHEVNASGDVADVEGFSPSFTAVGGFENAAFCVGRVEVAEHRDPERVGIGGVQHDAADVVAFGEAAPVPGFAAVGTAVHPGACVGGAAAVALATAEPNHVVFPVHSDVADGHGGFVVEYGFETRAVALGVPQPAAGVGDVHFAGVGGVHIDIGDAAGEHRRADAFGLEGCEEGVFFYTFPLLEALQTGLGWGRVGLGVEEGREEEGQ